MVDGMLAHLWPSGQVLLSQFTACVGCPCRKGVVQTVVLRTE